MRSCQRRFRCFLCHFSNSCHYVCCMGTRASPERRLPQRAGQDAALAQHCTGLGECAADRRPARGGCARQPARWTWRWMGAGRGRAWHGGRHTVGRWRRTAPEGRRSGRARGARGSGRRGLVLQGGGRNAGKGLRRWPPSGEGAAAIARGGGAGRWRVRPQPVMLRALRLGPARERKCPKPGRRWAAVSCGSGDRRPTGRPWRRRPWR